MPSSSPGEGDQAVADRLAAVVRTVPDFPSPGVQFRDITTLLGDRDAFHDAIDALTRPFAAESIDAVVGVESRGFVLGSPVAYLLGSAFVPVRKQGRLPAPTVGVAYTLEYGEAVLEIHADALRRGDRVLIVDDLLATGGTAAATIQLVEQLGGVVVGLTFLIELADLHGAAALGSHRHVSLITV